MSPPVSCVGADEAKGRVPRGPGAGGQKPRGSRSQTTQKGVCHGLTRVLQRLESQPPGRVTVTLFGNGMAKFV